MIGQARLALRNRPRTRASVVTLAGSLAGAICSFGAALVAAHSLSRGQFAFFGVGLAAGSLAVGLSDFGLGTVTVAETAQDWASGRQSTSYATLKGLARYRLVSVIALGAIATVAALVIPGLHAYRLYAAIGLGGAVFGSTALFLVAALQAARRFSVAAGVLCGQGLGRLALVGACALAGLGASEMLIAYLAGAPLLAGALGLSALLRSARAPLEGAVVESTTPPERAEQSDRAFRRAMWVAGVASAGVLNGDVLMLAVVSSQRQVAIYVSAWRVASGALLLNGALGSALLPHVMVTRDLLGDLRRTAKRGLWLALALLAMVGPFTLVGLWLLGSAGDGAGGPLAILFAAFALGAWTVVVGQYYLRAGHAVFIAGVVVASLVTMLVTIVLLGAIGANAPALGHLAGSLLSAVCLAIPVVMSLRGKWKWFDEATARPPSGEPDGYASAPDIA